MEKIAFISDIHSNLPALEATFEKIKSLGINKVYCLGDIIGYHTFTNEVINLLKDNKVISIKGNHDLSITEEAFNRSKDSDFVLYWNFDALTKDNLSYIKNLPETLDIKVEDVVIKLVHGSPNSITEYIREGSPEVDRYISEMTTDILMCGHTHLPYIAKRDGKFLLNTGSVGKPKFGKPEASFIIVTVNDDIIEPEIVSVPYNIKKMTEHLSQNNFPDKLIRAIETGLP